MSLAVVFSRARHGLDAPLVTVEVHISNGLPAFQLVGCRKPLSKNRVTAYAALWLTAALLFQTGKLRLI